MEMSSSIIWKNTSAAIENESTSVPELYLSELFIAANRGLLNFNIVDAFPRSVLRNSGLPDAYIEMYAADKTKIPENMRKAVVAEYEKALTSKNPYTGHYAYFNNLTGEYEEVYTEKNNYYRMLMGLPNLEDTDYIYNTHHNWNTTTPIHELNLVTRLEMEHAGILDELYAAHPDKEYIRFLGKRSIDYFTARIAERFEILYREGSSSDELENAFDTMYDRSRAMVNNVYYSNAFKKTNSAYDNFMAMCIVFMTIQGMMHQYLKVDVTRDFYDTESLKLVYDSYGVPFYTEIPLDYHRKIVKNMNKLISYKGSSQVFFDLFEIFDLGTMDLYSYFITKIHNLDEEGNPTFTIKKDDDGNPMYDADGNPILDPSNYRLKFSKVKIYDDPALSISDSTNDVEYNTVTVPDPYWIEDADLAEKLASENFNYLESKYIGIQTIFDLMKITYENAYIFRLITDNKEYTDNMEIRWTELNINCSIFDLFIYLASLYCRYYGYEGLISNKIPAIYDTLGYNFAEVADILESHIYTNPHLSPNEDLIKLLANLRLTNIDSIADAYDDIQEIREILTTGYLNAKTIDEFYAYRDLYNALLISKEITSVYTDPTTGEVFETFTDALTQNSPDLMQRYLLIHDEDISDEMSIVIDQIEKLIDNLKYLPFSAGVSSNNMIECLFKILKFFKSAKAELINYDITYIITMRGTNFFKMIDVIMSYFTQYGVVSNKQLFLDFIEILHETIKHKNELIPLFEKVSDPRFKIYLRDYIDQLTDMIVSFSHIIEHIFKDTQPYLDYIHILKIKYEVFSTMKLQDSDTDVLDFVLYEAKYKGLTKDQFLHLTDKIVDLTTPMLYASELMLMIDDLLHIKNDYLVRNSSHQSILHLIDLLYIVFKYTEEDSSFILNDLLTLIHDRIKIGMDDLTIYDEKLTSKLISFIGKSSLISEDLITALSTLFRYSDLIYAVDTVISFLPPKFLPEKDRQLYPDTIQEFINKRMTKDRTSLPDDFVEFIKTKIPSTLEYQKNVDRLYELTPKGYLLMK